MYPFTNSIKATRLWHMTGKKHFKSVVEDRRTTRPNQDMQHDKKNLATIYGVAMVSFLAVKYSFGWFKPKQYISPYSDPINIEKGSLPCTEKTKIPCPHTPQDFLPPCPCRDLCGNEKPNEKVLIKKEKRRRVTEQKRISKEHFKKKHEEEERLKLENEEKRKKRLAEGSKECDR